MRSNVKINPLALDRFIDAHLAAPISVTAMAEHLGLSVGFFIRALRGGLAMTPHRYVMERRLARARTLLAYGAAIADVAVDCGFADQAHLTRHMRAALGLTPGLYRSAQATGR